MAKARKKRQAETNSEPMEEGTKIPAWSLAEMAVMQRHPHMDGRIVAGSMAKEGNKVLFTFNCPRCPGQRRIATADAFQVWLCVPCTAEARKAARREKAAKK